MVLTCISLITVHMPVGLWISSFVKFLFKYFVHFLFGCLALICRNSLHIPDMSTLTVICITNIFSQAVLAF